MSAIDLTMTVTNMTAETFTLQSIHPSSGYWKSQPPASIGPSSSVSMEISSNFYGIAGSANYSGALNGDTSSFTVTGVVPNVGSNQFTSTVSPPSSLVITNNDPSGWSPHVTFTVADSLQPGDALSFKSMGSHSDTFLDGETSAGTVTLISSYDPDNHPGLNFELFQTPATTGSWYLKCLGTHDNVYLNGHTSSGDVELVSSYDPDDAGMHWAFIPISGQNGKYKIKCLGDHDYVWLNGHTSSGDVELSQDWSSSDGSLTWAIFDGILPS